MDGRPALPFGFAASPAIFSMCADVVHWAHHGIRPKGGPWSGWGRFYSSLFADDAVFVDAEVCDILADTSEGWGTSCRILFAPYSISPV